MDKHQAEIIADTLLTPAREAQQQEAQRQMQKQQRAESQRRYAGYILVGATVGTLIGYFVIGKVWPATFIGLALGGLLRVVWRKQI